ncbi:hypothetical protein CH35J_008245 [Colletotrichum higginsianum]|uniref:Uncharacterized protein n=1 Tax=Colletotrichum higginsianum TaxID=80884 RepID=A0A4T0VTX2_9PEZI|nr:hypothetical protein CH35J_008245 [Colletotrichum higginsianum]
MCRLVLFAGTCVRCNESLTWADLSQHLSCLEAKNADSFGGCRRGVDVETHPFDQECDACAGEDEGVAGMDFGGQQYQQYQQALASSLSASRSSGKRSGGGGCGGGREEGEGGKKKRART